MPPEPTPSGSDRIDSLEHPQAREIRRLLAGEPAPGPRRILIDDAPNILEALRAGVWLERLIHSDDLPPPDALRRALPPGVPLQPLARRTGWKLFGKARAARIFALARAPRPPTATKLAALARDLVVLEDPALAGNVGAVVRTAAALGVGAVVLLGAERIDPWDRRLIRASRGHVFSLPVVALGLAELLELCRAGGRRLLVATPRADRTVAEIAALRSRLVLAFGSERQGASEALERAADLRVRIPTTGAVESLNVSAAAAIALHARWPRNGGA